MTSNTDEFVMEALISYEKVPLLIHELLAIEVWRENVYPRLVELDFCEKTSMTAYMVVSAVYALSAPPPALSPPPLPLCTSPSVPAPTHHLTCYSMGRE